jgi:lipid A ethanolaminephosphotransferase
MLFAIFVSLPYIGISMASEKTFWTSARLVLLFAVFATVFANVTMFARMLEWTLASDTHWVYAVSTVLAQFLVLVLFVSLLTAHPAYRVLLAVLLLVTAASAYFVDSYGVVIDHDMLLNAAATNPAEAKGLLSLRMLGYLLVLFVVPVVWMFRQSVRRQTVVRRLGSHLGLMLVSGALIAGLVLSMSSFWVSFWREHPEIRVYSNPMAAIHASYKLIKKEYFSGPKSFRAIGQDAKIPESDVDRELVIVVVGETARADHFSLNGYERETNPLLSQRNDVVSFSNVSSCATATRFSVPCMFAEVGRTDFDHKVAHKTENALDVLTRSGVSILWRDNNSDSKGVADRMVYEDFMTPEKNPVCDPECRDIGLLHGLDTFIAGHEAGDILIVLHTMGSHGPAYYERVPDAFQKFQPICATNQLDQCSDEEIRNSYDNTILYADYFLDQTLDFLKQYDDRFETALLYVSDHGESLGENGVYLHGMPYLLAPDAQTHVPMLLWFGAQHTDLDIKKLQAQKDDEISHDNLFHTLLGMFEVSSSIYRPDMDLQQRALRDASRP